jgi:hypothetical protein
MTDAGPWHGAGLECHETNAETFTEPPSSEKEKLSSTSMASPRVASLAGKLGETERNLEVSVRREIL